MNNYKHLSISTSSFERTKKQTEFLYKHKLIADAFRKLASVSDLIGRYANSLAFVFNRKLSYVKRLETL